MKKNKIPEEYLNTMAQSLDTKKVWKRNKPIS
jgi:hypothetical protein